MSQDNTRDARGGFLARHPAGVLLAIVALAVAPRVYHIGAKSLWYDEAAMYWISSGTWKDVIAQNAAGNSAPPFYPLLLNLVTNLGTSEAWLRSIGCFAGIAAVPAMYFLARFFLARNPSFFCALLAAVSPLQVRYSREVREYSMVFLLSVLILLFLARFLRGRTFQDGVCLAALFAIGIWTQYGLAPLILAANLIVLFVLVFDRKDRGTLLARWTLVMLPAAASVVAVWFISLRSQFSMGVGADPATHAYLAQNYWNGTLRGLATLAFKNTYALIDAACPGAALAAFAIALGLIDAWRRRENRLVVMLFIVPLLIAFLLAVARAYPYGGTRQNIYLTPVIYLAVGLGFTRLAAIDPTSLSPVVLTAVLALNGLGLTAAHLNYVGQENLRPLAQVMRQEIRPGDRIYVHYGGEPAFRYYWRDRPEPVTYGAKCPGTSNDCEAEIGELLTAPGRVWLVFVHNRDEHRFAVADVMSRSRRLVRSAEDRWAWIYLFE